MTGRTEETKPQAGDARGSTRPEEWSYATG